MEEKPQPRKQLDSQDSESSYEKPRFHAPEPRQSQHIKILDCNKPVRRVFYECYKCKQGLLTECGDPDNKEQYLENIDVQCPTCGRTAIKLTTGKVISTTPIPSPWSK